MQLKYSTEAKVIQDIHEFLVRYVHCKQRTVTVACQSIQIEQSEQDLPAKTMHITPWHLNEHKVYHYKQPTNT